MIDSGSISGKHSDHQSGRPSTFTVMSEKCYLLTLPGLIEHAKCYVHDNIIRRKLKKCGLFVRVAGENLFCLKRAWNLKRVVWF